MTGCAFARQHTLQHIAQLLAHLSSFCRCKGAKIRALKLAGTGPIIYSGDGSNDICACKALGAGDVVLARKGHPLGKWGEQQMQQQRGGSSPQRAVYLWETHEELEALVTHLVTLRA